MAVTRKQRKRKRRACGLCKPHKRGLDNRWSAKERAEAEMADREMHDYGDRVDPKIWPLLMEWIKRMTVDDRAEPDGPDPII